VKSITGNYGFIDSKGKEVLKPQFSKEEAIIEINKY
jgi:hypothetical protein